MIVFKIIKQGEYIFFKVNTTDRVKAVRLMWKRFGDQISYEII